MDNAAGEVKQHKYRDNGYTTKCTQKWNMQWRTQKLEEMVIKLINLYNEYKLENQLWGLHILKQIRVIDCRRGYVN